MDPYLFGLVGAVTLLAVAIGWYRDRSARREFEESLDPEEMVDLRTFLSADGNSWHDFMDIRQQRHLS